MIRIHRSAFAVVLLATLIPASFGSAQPAKPGPAAPPAKGAATAKAATTAAAAATGTAAPATSGSAAPATTSTAAPSTQPATNVSEEAGRTFSEGRDAFRNGQFEQALASFQKSYALEPTPGVLLNIALAEEKLGKPATALQHFERAAELFKSDDDRLPIARDGMARTALRTPRLKIERAAGAPPTLAIALDGQAVAANLIGEEQRLEPGVHVITTQVYGFEDRRYEVTLAEGQHVPLAVGPGARILGPAATTTAAPSSGPSPARLVVFGLGGAGIASLGVGLVTGILALGKAGALEEACPDPGQCTSLDGRTALGQARTLADVSTGTLIFGAAAVAAGAVVFFTTGGTSVALRGSAAPGAAGLTASGRF
jgi:hypothetical protein